MADNFLADILDNTASSVDSVIDGLSSLTSTYIGLEKIIPSVSEAFGKESSELRLLNKQLGTNTKTSAALRGEMAKLSRQYGLSTTAQMSLLGVTKQYHKGLSETASTTLQFIKASGASIDVVGKFAAKMRILGNDSEDVFNSMYTSILAVRDAYGLTSEQVDLIASSLSKYAVIVGITSKNAEEAATNMSMFASKLTSVGIEAETVTKLLDSMVDPEKMRDNIALLSRMGLTIEDMVSGDPAEKLNESAVGLKGLGEQIKEVADYNRFAANEIAKIYGLSLEEGLQLAEIDTSEIALNRSKTIENYRQEVTSLSDNVENLGSILKGAFMQPISILSDVIEKFTNTLSILPSSVVATLTVLIGAKVLKGLREKIGNACDKIVEAGGSAAKNFEKNLSPAISGYLGAVEAKANAKNEDVQKIKDTSSRAQAQINKFNASQSNTPWKDYIIQKMEARENYNKNDSGKAKEQSFGYKELNQKIEAYASMKYENDARIDELIRKETSIGLTGTEIKEKNSLLQAQEAFYTETSKQIKNLENVVLNIKTTNDAEFNILKNNFTQRQEKQQQDFVASNKDDILSTVKNLLGSDAQKYVKEEILLNKDSEGKINTDALSSVINASDTAGILKSIQDAWQAKLDVLNSDKEKVQKSGDDNLIKEWNNAHKEATEAIEKLTEAYNAAASKIIEEADAKEAIIQADKAVSSMMKKNAAEEKPKVTFGDWRKATDEFIRKKLKNTALNLPVVKQARGLINFFKPGQDEAGEEITVKDKIRNKWSSVKTTVGRGAVAAAEGTKKAIGGALKGLGFGAMGIVLGGIAKAVMGSEKMQEIMSKATEKINEAFTSLADTLGPTLDTIWDALSPVLDNVVNTISPILTNIINSVTPLISQIATNIIPLAADIATGLMPILKPMVTIVSKVLSWLLKPIEWILKGVNKVAHILGGTAEDISTISVDTQTLSGNYTDKDLKQMTLVYASEESIRNGQIYKMLGNMEKRLDSISINTKETTSSIQEQTDFRYAQAVAGY